MVEKMLEAIHSRKDWLRRFNKKQYAGAFEEYRMCFGPVYTAALQQVESEADLRTLAEQLLDALEASWEKTSRWRRNAVEYDDKLTMLFYLNPMLLAKEDEPWCEDFAYLLQELWAQRHPGDIYELSTYDKLVGGFRNMILGIELPKKD